MDSSYQTTNIPHYHIPDYHEYKFSEKCDSAENFGSCTNITDNLRINIILVPIESPDFALSIGFRTNIIDRARIEFEKRAK